MRILSITAQKPHSTGSGVYLTSLVRAFRALGHENAVVAGLTRADGVSFPEGTEFFPVYYETDALPFPVCGMSDEMPYPSTRYRDLGPAKEHAFRRAFLSAVREAVSAFRPDLIVVDIPYSPLCTKMRAMAKGVGCKTMNGLGMMLFQGSAAFELWTGEPMPIEYMKEILNIRYDD